MRIAWRTLLVLATVLFLLSMGGGMLFVWWVLVPLHWVAARDSGPGATAGWALLAAASMGEVGWMVGYVAIDDEVVAALIGLATSIATAALFLAARLRRISPLRA